MKKIHDYVAKGGTVAMASKTVRVAATTLSLHIGCLPAIS